MRMLGFLFSLLGTVAIHAQTNSLQENIAIKGRAVQSSTHQFNPFAAVDKADNSCIHTSTETDPWWRLNLKESEQIKEVVITNRIDCCTDQIDEAVVHVGNSLENNGNNNPSCVRQTGLPAGRSVSFSCNGTEGLYVNVVIPGVSKNLTLCEVRVYSMDGFILKENADQSSAFKYWNAERAIDGIKLAPGFASFCARTKLENNPWWRLDLVDIYYIHNVIITSRADCCPGEINGAEIRIGNSLVNNGNNNPRCAVISNIPAGASYSYSCPEMEGRYVNVILPELSKYLTLCEVEVYGILTGRKTFVRIKFSSTSDPDNDKLLYQLQSALASRGITDVKMSWTKLPQQEHKQEENDKGQCKIIP